MLCSWLETLLSRSLKALKKRSLCFSIGEHKISCTFSFLFSLQRNANFQSFKSNPFSIAVLTRFERLFDSPLEYFDGDITIGRKLTIIFRDQKLRLKKETESTNEIGRDFPFYGREKLFCSFAFIQSVLDSRPKAGTKGELLALVLSPRLLGLENERRKETEQLCSTTTRKDLSGVDAIEAPLERVGSLVSDSFVVRKALQISGSGRRPKLILRGLSIDSIDPSLFRRYLTVIDLSKNALRSLSCLLQGPNLVSDEHSDRIRAESALSSCSRYREVDDTVENDALFPELLFFDLSSNLLSDAEEAGDILLQCPKLKSFNAKNNPFIVEERLGKQPQRSVTFQQEESSISLPSSSAVMRADVGKPQRFEAKLESVYDSAVTDYLVSRCIRRLIVVPSTLCHLNEETLHSEKNALIWRKRNVHSQTGTVRHSNNTSS